jgi:hypothetical protein
MRALWYQHRQFGPGIARDGVRDSRRMTPYGGALQMEWGRRLPALGVIPAGRAVRVRAAHGGATARRVVQSKPVAARIYTDHGDQGGRYAVAAQRDWA